MRILAHALAAASLALAGAALTGGAMAADAHADASSTTQPAACKLALTLARQGLSNSQILKSHCECLENKDDRAAPWSCTAFVTHR